MDGERGAGLRAAGGSHRSSDASAGNSARGCQGLSAARLAPSPGLCRGPRAVVSSGVSQDLIGLTTPFSLRSRLPAGSTGGGLRQRSGAWLFRALVCPCLRLQHWVGSPRQHSPPQAPGFCRGAWFCTPGTGPLHTPEPSWEVALLSPSALSSELVVTCELRAPPACCSGLEAGEQGSGRRPWGGQDPRLGVRPWVCAPVLLAGEAVGIPPGWRG